MRNKIEVLCEIEGFECIEDLMDEYICDSLMPGICMTPGCDYTTMVEHDNDSGYCEFCADRTVKSAMEIALF